MEHQVFSILNQKIDEHVQQFSSVLTGGGCESYDQYKELCGAIRGLRTAQLEINDLARNLKEVDDE